MPKRIAPLSEIQARNAKPKAKDYKLFDGQGLFLLVTPTGGKLWRFKYRFGGTEKLLTLGAYPQTSLTAARKKRDEARNQIAAGIDPATHRKTLKQTSSANQADSFEIIAREWFTKYSPNWAASHSGKIIRRLELDVFPWIGAKPIREINAPDLLRVIQRIEARGALDTAHRALNNCSQIFRFAVPTGRADRDPTGDLRGALPPVKKKHFATITDTKRIGALLRDMDAYEGSFVTKCAMRLASLVFVRPGELRRAEWAEIDWEAREWHIPAHKMKMGEKHIVPLSRQALAILDELKPLTGRGRYLFPGARTNGEPLSNNTVNAALRRLGYAKEEMTGHGFRSMASTLLNERGWNRDAIERQLAHAERDNVRAAYNYAEFLPERRRMMQAWADYLDALRKGAEVIPFRRELGT